MNVIVAVAVGVGDKDSFVVFIDDSVVASAAVNRNVGAVLIPKGIVARVAENVKIVAALVFNRVVAFAAIYRNVIGFGIIVAILNVVVACAAVNLYETSAVVNGIVSRVAKN